MIKFILTLCCLFLITSCIPLVKESHVSKIDDWYLNDIVSNNNESIMVIPIWVHYPTLFTDESIENPSKVITENPIFKNVNKATEIHKKISSKTNVGMIIGPGGYVGRGVSFYGYVIFSECGKIIFFKSDPYNTNPPEYITMNPEDKKELLKTFSKSGKVQCNYTSNFCNLSVLSHS